MMSRMFSFLACGSVLGLSLGLTSTANAQASASPYTWAMRYDGSGKVVGMIAPDPNGALQYAAVRNSYDSSGNLIKIEKGALSSWKAETVPPPNWSGFTIRETVDFTYDALGRKLTERVKGWDPNVLALVD